MGKAEKHFWRTNKKNQSVFLNVVIVYTTVVFGCIHQLSI